MLLGSWGYPDIGDARVSEQVAAMGFDTFSHGGGAVKRGALAERGLRTNCCPGRPDAGALLKGLGLKRADLDQKSDGELAGEGVNISSFHPTVLRRFIKHIGDFIKQNAGDENIRTYMLSSPISLYGESHYTISLDGGHMVFSRPAVSRYRAFIKTRYKTVRALNEAYGTKYRSFDQVRPPEGPEDTEGAGLDLRREWSDFVVWYNKWMDLMNGRSLDAARKYTDKPLGLMLGGPKVGFIQGIACGHTGPVVKSITKRGAGFLSDTDSQTLFSVRYSRAACRLYGADLQIEHTGPPYLEPFHQYNTFINTLAGGPEILHLAHRGELFEEGNWFRDIYTRLTPVLKRYRTRPPVNEIAFFHSYITAMFRPDSSNADVVSVYDRTNKIWFPTRRGASFARALGNPETVDDVMLEDGALAGRKLLIIPNTSVTVTTAKAMDAIRKWVEGGGVLLCFGDGCLAYEVGRDGALRASPGARGLRAAPENPQTDRGGDKKVSVKRLCAGKAIWSPDAIKPFDTDSTKSALALTTGLMNELGIGPAASVMGSDEINLIDCGADAVSGTHIFALDCITQVHPDVKGARFAYDKSYTLLFAAPLEGPAEILGITDAGGVYCKDADVRYERGGLVFTLRFKMPCEITLTFGGDASGTDWDALDPERVYPTYLP